MKKLLSLLAALALVFTLAACGGNDDEVTSSEDYNGLYGTHYATLNYLYSAFAGDNQYTANFVDGLVENDRFGRIEPALAESWEVIDNADGTQTWKFQIKEGNYWVDRDGEEVAEVTANDWVAAAKWILTPANASQVFPLMLSFIDGAEDYYNALNDGTNANFDTVGVKATSKYVLEYTLPSATPYFITALTYNVFYPVNEEYLNNAGTMFGLDGDNILYVGAYLMDEDELDAKISMKPNPKYWDPESVNIQKISFFFQPDDVSVDFARLKYENGEINSFTLRENDSTGWETYVTGECYGEACEGSLINPVDPRVAVEDSVGHSTYYFTWNYDRQDFTSSTTEESTHAATRAAIKNVAFRQGFLYGVNRSTFTAYWNPSNPSQWVRNTYMFPELATDQNGVDYMDHYNQLFADKKGVTLEEAQAMNADGQDGFMDYEKAHESFQKAVAELKAEGLTDADFPIQMEMVFDVNANRGPYMQELIDDFNTEFAAYVELVEMYPSGGDHFDEMLDNRSYDFRLWYAGWGPDYADPHTFMGTFVVEGDVVDYAGLYPENLDVQEEVLGAYTALVDKASAITNLDKIDERFMAYAEAEYSLIWEETLMVPLLSVSGKQIYVSNTMPYTAMRAPYGLADEKFKDRVILSNPLTREERAAAKEQYEADKAAARAE
ncbi:ABC transporter substrate-binding protein [Mycoplasmatota bacterium WC44]